MQRGDRWVPAGYEWIRVLGVGGHGSVSLARHRALDRVVAVKCIASAPGSAVEAAERFRREARTLAHLDHPAIVRLYDVLADDGTLYLVMEYVDGNDFRAQLAMAQPDIGARVRVLQDVAAALAYAGARGIVHRDVKPGNVFVLRDGGAKVGDFGIARVLGDTTVSFTASGSVLGTPAYMAPEQILGDGDVGPSADVYAFAAMAFEATVGRPPFEADSVREVLDAHLLRPAPDPSALLTGYPDVAADAVLAGLGKDPATRPPVAVIAEALASVPPERWPMPLPPRARPAQRVPIDTATIATGARDRTPTTTSTTPESRVEFVGPSPSHSPWLEPTVFVPEPSASRHRWVLVAAVTALVALVGAFALFGHGPASSTTPLRVRAVTVRIPAAERSGDCTDASFTFLGRVVTNGQDGVLRVQWRGPDGVSRPPTDLAVASGRTVIEPELHFSVDGPGELEGRATLEVLEPRRVAATSPVVLYSCP